MSRVLEPLVPGVEAAVMPPADRAAVDPVEVEARRRRPARAAAARRGARGSRFVGYGIGLGLLVRAIFLLNADFPLNDGGLFFQMARELRAANFALPQTTAYNAAGIPFAYPPLALYVAALLELVAPGHLIDIFRYLPAVVSGLSLIACWRLARLVLPQRASALLALFAFAIHPDALIWFVMGGGLTRAFGLLFALLALAEVYQLYATGDRRRIVTAAVLASATVLSHLQWGFFVAFSAAVMWCCVGRTRRSFAASVGVAAGVVALTSVWWGPVLLRHGAATLLAPFAGNLHDVPVQASLLYVLFLRLTSEVMFPSLSVLGLLGFVVCLKRREALLPVWAVACLVMDHRSPLQSLAVPLALLAGVGLAAVVLPLVARGRVDLAACADDLAALTGSRAGVAAAALLLLVSAVGTVAGLRVDPTPLARPERAAMAWAAAETPPSATFVVVAGDRWQSDRAGEWFPVLAERPSLSTVQGTEWLPGGRFGTAIDRHRALVACAARGIDCVEAWRAETGVDFTHLYAAHREVAGLGGEASCDALIATTKRDPRYVLVYENDGASIFHRRAN